MRNIKRVVITGATSSLGVALITECIKKRIVVLALANKGSENLAAIPQSDYVNVIECGAEDFATGENILCSDYVNLNDGFDVFFHFAWLSSAGDDARNKLKSQEKNIQYSLDSVDLAKQLGCNLYIGAGSQAEYGKTEDTITENTPCYPETAYGMAKLCAGHMTRLYCAQKGIEHIWPRILSGYGPNCRSYTIINYTITELLSGRSPKLTKCEQIWDFMYTEDIARALLMLARDGKSGETYVVGSGHSRVLKDYIEDIRHILGTDVSVSYGECDYNESTVMHLSCDITKLRNDTGFSPQISFAEGVRNTIKWIQSKKNESAY